MTENSYVVVAEIGLTKNSYGAEIRTTEPMGLTETQAFLQRVLAGDEPDLYRPPADARVLRIEAIDQYLVVGGNRLRPDMLTRLSIAAVSR
jgi:hypothetical protein